METYLKEKLKIDLDLFKISITIILILIASILSLILKNDFGEKILYNVLVIIGCTTLLFALIASFNKYLKINKNLKALKHLRS